MSYESGVVYIVPIEQGHVVNPPIWEEHYPRARNWLARVEEDPDAPGGIRRKFMDRGKGRFKYSVELLVEDDTIEFGADRMHFSKDGRFRSRWVGEIVGLTEDQMQVRYFKGLKELFAYVNDRNARTREAPE